ncbi:sodium- and chloride-dependent glycine transporter 1-like isoform X2 [Mya arenaria]|uniref:sodium- and chloride-dependent glycine transporter 1-like isoform X2 n=1 Tax=Mya arenaria TaxID=6604 RepID=UPI0022E49784|nr:sodium- and chloride-dependent glycine transporter 1-like isoform X2 [Mya arenaria]
MAEKEVTREKWDRKLDFILSCVGFAVGLGNVWRFPYLCYRNGGGAFLVPYVIMLVIAGMPIFFFELALGQFSSEGPITIWKVNPLFYGVGWGMVVVSGLVCIYYNVIIMYAIYYMFVSLVNLDGEVPWKYCGQPWNTDACRNESFPDFASMENETQKVSSWLYLNNQSCVNSTISELVTAGLVNAGRSAYDIGYGNLSDTFSDNFTDCARTFESSSEQYWTRFVLRYHEANGLEDVGNVSLKNVICLFLAWILVFFCLMKGIKSSGKVVYFTATFPYLLITVLLIRGLTLPGHKEGIEFYMIPEWEKLKDIKVWSDAATQIFYSLGVAFGGLACMSSYNRFNNNCWRDSVIVAVINCGTSIYAGFAIFSLLGFMAYQTNQEVKDVADSGPGLAFVAYPEGLAQLPVSALWSLLFFFMIITLGLDSQMVMMETVIGGITDIYPNVLRKHKSLFVFVCCMIGFLLGIPLTTKGGILVLTMFDWYSGSYNLMILSLCELIAICYIYGIKQFMSDIEMMIGKRLIIFWCYYLPMWMVITPVAIIFIVVMSGVNYTPAYYGDYHFPPWAEGIGWVLAMLPLLCVIIGAIFALVKFGPEAIKPRPGWGPRPEEDRGDTFKENLGYEASGGENENDIPYSIENRKYANEFRM